MIALLQNLNTIELIILLVFGLAALIQLLYYWVLFARLAFYKKPENNSENLPAVSVVISARNEYYNLLNNLELILQQDYPDFELVVVNHASNDESKYFLEEMKAKYNNLKIVQIDQDLNFFSGKKFPLSIGIKSAKNDILLLTDADCKPVSNKWIRNMVSSYGDEKTEVILAYGPHKKEKGFLNLLIRYDTFITATQYLSYALAGLPYMGVGRNLSYRKSLFIRNKGFISHYNIPSGDDDLFINRVANKKNCKIEIAKESFIYSKAKSGFKEWYRQKLRHLSTGKVYKTKFKILLSTYVFSQIFFYLSFTYLVISMSLPIIVISVFGLRLITQLFVNKKVSSQLDEGSLYLFSPIMEVIFLILLPIFSLISMRTKVAWK
ncbi:MAG: hypothetical protein C0598_07940 [Marinilabiliales bacterium]|nr:MAG: hypothetical protein C0598_07940 [Marinilabiliales bacterium]